MPVRLVKKAGIAIEEQRQQREIIDAWRPFPAAKRFMRDHAPAIWDEVSRCRLTGFYHDESKDRPGLWKVVPRWSCKQVPWCINCTRAARARRVMDALNAFNRCTPEGKKPRFIHIVQTAPIYHAGHQFGPDSGWGVEASHDHHAFAKLVWATTEEFYGKGIGGVLSYQDFGEQGFHKRHPHIDFTLNGWMLQDGQPALVPTINLRGKGRAKWDAAIQARASRFRIDAGTGNVDFTPAIVGRQRYYGVLSYQMRELVDLRKMRRYDRGDRYIDWQSYKPPYPRTRIPVFDFLAALAEYENRLGVFTQEGHKQLHTSHGHMAKRVCRKAQAAFGGSDIPHGRRCPCRKCGDWERHYPDEVESFHRRIPVN